MSGTINLSLSQQFSNAGLPLSGGKLYFYQAATTTPQNAYKDTALTLAHPNPIILDSSGRVPEFWLADGNIKFVLTDKNGVVQISSNSTQVLGPSSGSSSGSTVDSTTIFQTGDVMWLDVSGTRPGWVRDNGRSIGSATSGATERANSDCQLLYVFLWTNFSNSICPVNGGRGASAAADWAANKYITLPDKRRCAPGGLDDMGNAAAGGYTGIAVISGGVTTAGSIIGENLRTMAESELPVLAPSITAAAATQYQSNEGNVLRNNSGGQIHVTDLGSGGTAIWPADARNFSSTDIAPPSTGDLWTAPFGGGAGHPNVSRTVLGTFFRKL